MSETVVIFRAHKKDKLTILAFEKLANECPYEVIPLFNEFNSIVWRKNDAINFTFEEIANLGFQLPAPDIINLWDKKTIPSDPRQAFLWYCQHYTILYFYLHKKKFHYYWSIEYDCSFNGNWKTFFKAFENNESDFLGTYLTHCQDSNGNLVHHGHSEYWNSLLSYNYEVPTENKFTSFGPIQRYSNFLLGSAHNAFKAGFIGYYEQAFPTICSMIGGVMNDINETKKHRNFYDFKTMTGILMPELIKIIPTNLSKLYHPINTEELFRKMS